jgi:hypothetical protein
LGPFPQDEGVRVIPRGRQGSAGNKAGGEKQRRQPGDGGNAGGVTVKEEDELLEGRRAQQLQVFGTRANADQ